MMTVSAVEGGKVICIRVDDEKNVEEPFEPTALVLEEEAIPPAKGEDWGGGDKGSEAMGLGGSGPEDQ
jgi:hypothetical protein